METWISVKDELPNSKETVLVYGGFGFGIDTDYYYADRWERRNITHWMPLPPPPLQQDLSSKEDERTKLTSKLKFGLFTSPVEAAKAQQRLNKLIGESK